MQKIIGALAALFLILVSSVHGEEIYLKSESLIEFKSNLNNQPEVPFNQYVTLDLRNKSIDFITDFGAFGDPYGEQSDFHLYATSLAFKKIGNVFDIKAGRFNLTDAFNVNTIDGGEIGIHFNDYLTFRSYIGAQRFIEESDFVEGNFITGAILSLENYKNNSLAFKFEYEDALYANDYFMRVGTSFHHYFDILTAPEIYSNVEVEASYGTLQELTAGFRFYPGVFVWDSSFSYVDTEATIESKEWNILRITAVSPMYAFNQELRINPHEVISLFTAYEFSTYEYDVGVTSYGNSIESGFDLHDHYFSKMVTASGFYKSSFGGEFYGARLIPEIHLFKILTLRSYIELVQFTKITNEEGIAYTQDLSSTIKITERVSFNIKGEYNSNDELNNDVRGYLGLIYEYF